MFTYASTVYIYFCNLSTKLIVPPLVDTSLLNHFEDFVKTLLSLNTSVTDPFSVPTDSHLQELPDPGTLRTNTLLIQQEILWRSFNSWNTGSSNPPSSRNLS